MTRPGLRVRREPNPGSVFPTKSSPKPFGVEKAFASGQNLYVFHFTELARALFAIGGEATRVLFLTKVGEHLDTWNTQPRHRQAWKQSLESL